MGEKKDKKKPKAEKSDKKSDDAKKDKDKDKDKDKKKKKKEDEPAVKSKKADKKDEKTEKKEDKTEKKKDKKDKDKKEKTEKKEGKKDKKEDKKKDKKDDKKKDKKDDKKEVKKDKKKDDGDKKKAAKKDKKDDKKKDKKDDDKKAKSSADTKKSSKKDKESPVKTTVCCICKEKNASTGGLCKHDFCVPCLEGLLHKPIEDETLWDNHLSAPTLGRCPECETELRKFEMKDNATQKLKYERITDIKKSPLHGKTFHPKDKKVQFGSFHFDSDPRPFMNYKDAIESDKDMWMMNDGTQVEEKKFFEEGCHFDAKTRTFHGTIKWAPISFQGAHQWDVVLGFNKKLTAIHIGLIHEHKERVLEKKEKKDGSEEELYRYEYPLDGKWKLIWSNSSGKEQTGSITVNNNEFQQGPYLFNLNFDEAEKPRFRWPLDPVYAAAISGVNLKKKPMGPSVGERILWETTHPAFSTITWERETIGEAPCQRTIHFGVGANEYSIIGAEKDASIEDEESEEEEEVKPEKVKPEKDKSEKGKSEKGKSEKSKSEKRKSEKSKSEDEKSEKKDDIRKSMGMSESDDDSDSDDSGPDASGTDDSDSDGSDSDDSDSS